MQFRINNQSISDIELFSKYENVPSLFNFYNRTQTPGGEEQLYKIISTPISEKQILENRKAEILFIFNLNNTLKLNKKKFEFVEFYLRNKHLPLKNNLIDATWDKLVNHLKSSNDLYVIREGVYHLCGILKNFKVFLENIQDKNQPDSLNKSFTFALNYLNEKTISFFIENLPNEPLKLKQRQINQLDNFFRVKKKNELKSVLFTIYELDVLQSNCELLREKNFSLPEYSDDDSYVFEATDCFHPLLSAPIPNSFRLDRTSSTVLLTGPNMSGKSTFLKTVGILTYFAHLGLPVPAMKLVIPVLGGLFTTINLSDSLSQGFSHFYSEVNRIREMSLEIQENSKLVVVLDELFRGTNVKDAQDGTLLVVSLLSKIQGTFFFISTHILEVAEKLTGTKNIDFKCFESILNIDKPVYDFKLKNGVSAERVGMQIIKGEGIEEILTDIILKQNMSKKVITKNE